MGYDPSDRCLRVLSGWLPGGVGGLYLGPNDAAKLAAGWHTLKIDYLGSSTYAPSEYVARFLVVK